MSRNRRITEILPSFWYDLKGDSDLPDESIIKPKDIEDLIDGNFIVKAYYSEDYESSISNLSSIADKEIEIILQEKINSEIKKAKLKRIPISSEGEFQTSDNITIKYRQSLLPIKSINKKDTYVIGAIKWKKYK